MIVWQIRTSAVCETRPPPYCWKYTAVCPKPCVPVTPCRPTCTSCPPAVVPCPRTPDARCPTVNAPSCGRQSVRVCCPPERFSSSCSSPTQHVAVTDCRAPCDLNSYCIKSSPLSCNPCLGRRSFRQCSAFTRPSASYRDWCVRCVQEPDNEQPTTKRSRKSSGGRKDGSRSSSAVNDNVRRSSSRASSVFNDNKKRSRRLSSRRPTGWTVRDEDTDVQATRKNRNSRGRRQSTLKGRLSEDDDDDEEEGSSRQSTAANAARDSSTTRVSRMSSRPSVMANVSRGCSPVVNQAPVACGRHSSNSVGYDDDGGGEVDEFRKSSTTRLSRKPSRASSEANENDLRRMSSAASTVDDDDDEAAERRRRSSSVTSTPRPTRTSSQRSGQSSVSSGSGSRSSGMRVRFSSNRKSSTPKKKYRKTPFRLMKKSSRSASSSLRSSRSSSANDNRRRQSSVRSIRDDEDDDHRAQSLVNTLAECITGNVCTLQPASRVPPDNGQPTRTELLRPHWCRTSNWNTRDRFSLSCMPFYRSGHRAFPDAMTRCQQTQRLTCGASTVTCGDRQSYLLPDAQGARRQASISSVGGQVSSSGPRSTITAREAALISSMPAPGSTSMPARPTITGTSTGQVSVAAPPPPPLLPPPHVGYREQHVTTKTQNVRFTQQQNYTSNNAPATRPPEESRRADSGLDNRNQSAVTSVALCASSDPAGDVVTGANHSTPVPVPAAATELTDGTAKVKAMFQEARRAILEAFQSD